MRKSRVLLAGVAVAAAAAATSAFTASNSLPSSGNVLGYGEVTVTGATISATHYTLVTGDKTRLDHIVFASSTDITGETATLTLKSTGGTVVVGTYTCTLGAYATGTMDVTCATGDTPLLSDFDTVGLTVVS
jgi:hypothetical protein